VSEKKVLKINRKQKVWRKKLFCGLRKPFFGEMQATSKLAFCIFFSIVFLNHFFTHKNVAFEKDAGTRAIVAAGSATPTKLHFFHEKNT
jgi:hypothetical protein